MNEHVKMLKTKGIYKKTDHIFITPLKKHRITYSQAQKFPRSRSEKALWTVGRDNGANEDEKRDEVTEIDFH
jgi:hypothetical protein